MRRSHFNLQKVLWRSVDLVKGLLAGIWHGLHDASMETVSGRRGGGRGRRRRGLLALVGAVAVVVATAALIRRIGTVGAGSRRRFGGVRG